MRAFLALAALVSGLHGTVTRGPTMPVCIAGQPCTAPAPGLVLVFSRRGRDVARVRTGPRGGYRLLLAPGLYDVRTATHPSVGRGLSPRTVRVPRGRVARVNFALDTGIR